MTIDKHESEDRGLLPYIAAFKFLKALLLVALGVAALGIGDHGIAERVQQWLSFMSSASHREFFERQLSRLLRLGPHRLLAVAIGAWLYAALFLVEGVGLWKRRRWAEYLTVIATISFIPFEIYEVVHGVTVARVSALVINVAVAIYLVVRLRRRSHG